MAKLRGPLPRPLPLPLASASFAALSLVAACEPSTPETPDAYRLRRDADLDAPAPEIPDTGPRPICPPSPPYGSSVGDVIADFTVYDCDGTPFTLHSLCETDVVWMWELAEWCAACRYFAEDDYDLIYQRYEAMYGDRFAALAVITATDTLELPTQEICAEMRDRYHIESPIYFDPTGHFRDLIGPGYSNDVHAILTRGMEIEWTMQFGGDFVNRRLSETFEAIDMGTAIPDGGAVELDAGPLDDVTLTPDAGASEDAGTADDAG